MLPRLKVNEAQQILCICLAPDGNNEAKMNHLLEVAHDWKTKMLAAQLPQDATELV